MISEKIRNARERKGWTQAHLAKMVGCDYCSISLIEKGAQRPSIELLIKIYEALNLRIDPIYRRCKHGDKKR